MPLVVHLSLVTKVHESLLETLFVISDARLEEVMRPDEDVIRNRARVEKSIKRLTGALEQRKLVQ
jgi:hypothetical protein